MACVYFSAVQGSASKLTGVTGYCRGCPTGEVRVPSVNEYTKFCSGDGAKDCPLWKARQNGKKNGVRERAQSLLPHA
jgi:hypothetical protein